MRGAYLRGGDHTVPGVDDVTDYEDMLRQSAELDEHEDEDEDEEYEVEEILGKRTDEKGNVEYLVKWLQGQGKQGGFRSN